MTTISTAPQRGVLASFATIRALTNIFVGSVALMFAMTATADFPAETGTGPQGIAIDAEGNVYTANYGSNNVSKITPDGTSTIFAATGTGTGPYGIALDADGNVYTANLGSDNVSKITPDGTSSILGITGTEPSGIAIDATGNVYTPNSGSNNVSKITPDGTSSILGTTGDAPVAIAIDAAGNVYTANYSSNNVSKILAPVAPVPVGPLWLLGMMAGLLSLVAVRKLRKA